MALTQEKIKPAEFVRNVFAVVLPLGTKFEEIKDPAYWAHTAAKLHPTDRIEVMDEEGTFFAELLVVSCARNWAKVSVLRFHELVESLPTARQQQSDAMKDERAKYKVDWQQGTKARVIRLSDKQTLIDNLPSKADAEQWLTRYLSTTQPSLV